MAQSATQQQPPLVEDVTVKDDQLTHNLWLLNGGSHQTHGPTNNSRFR